MKFHLDRRITLQRATTAQDETGQEVQTWANLIPTGDGKIWSKWRPASARETLASAEVAAAITDIFDIRFDSAWADLNAKDRLLYNGKTYDIASVVEIDRREGLRITASARAD